MCCCVFMRPPSLCSRLKSQSSMSLLLVLLAVQMSSKTSLPRSKVASAVSWPLPPTLAASIHSLWGIQLTDRARYRPTQPHTPTSTGNKHSQPASPSLPVVLRLLACDCASPNRLTFVTLTFSDSPTLCDLPSWRVLLRLAMYACRLCCHSVGHRAGAHLVTLLVFLCRCCTFPCTGGIRLSRPGR